MNSMERIAALFREAVEAENARDLERAKKKLDEIMGMTKNERPEVYFEACFRLADILLQEDNYRGAVKCAIRAVRAAPNDELYRLGLRMLGDILFMMKENGRLAELGKDMEVTLSLIKDREELHRFVLTIIRLARGEDVEGTFESKEMREIIESLKG
ncbi:hypothetical protein E3E36_03780 [Thermococcus sp. M36]|uniref:tetratricopeptide repeat protein n=1 Tax=Thermococcus sp. M36 TaxID=1638261 RepID=UPI001438C1F6|nr:hypothetical protein [Thermococcus sp. M36]NJE05276.1 hypothetical protein [Thermococcus sp. M36]